MLSKYEVTFVPMQQKRTKAEAVDFGNFSCNIRNFENDALFKTRYSTRYSKPTRHNANTANRTREEV